jgi:hypothetical protein
MDESRPLIAVLGDEPQFCRALSRLLKTVVSKFSVGKFKRLLGDSN